MTTVVNLRFQPYDVYIGRLRGIDEHFGNPFSHVGSSLARVRVQTREDAIMAFASWLRGTAYRDVEPRRRNWILENLHTLTGKRLGCFCAPQPCHGDVLARLADHICICPPLEDGPDEPGHKRGCPYLEIEDPCKDT